MFFNRNKKKVNVDQESRSGLISASSEFRPFGVSVNKAFLVNGTKDLIVLLNGKEAMEAYHRNIVRIDEFGHIIWEVGEPPDRMITDLKDKPDTYLEITKISEPKLFAYSHLGFFDEIDPNTGTVLSSTFAK
jgi:hypothetical protein